MPIAVPDALDFLRTRAAALSDALPVAIPDVPAGELARSPAAHRVAELAAQSGLFLFHYEHRAHLELPEAWVPAGQPELASPPTWDGGVLPERKYQSFRHDLPLGGYHPGHRAKWSTHELCHGLVGFAWKPDASPLFLATAGRLAELLPVVLWYGLDEAFLRRCPDHRGRGALFRELCPRCEALAAATAEDPDAERHLEMARAFLDGELAAIARTRREGRPVAWHHATLNLCSDGLAYAAAHGSRLCSPEFARYIEAFGVAGAAWHTSLDELEERVVAVARAICGADLDPHVPTPEHGRWLWTLQDLGWRLIQIRAQTEGDAATQLDRIIADLADAVPEAHERGAAAVVQAHQAYTELFDSWFVPSPTDVFAVGYPLPDGLGSSVSQLEAGIRSAMPLTTAVLESDLGTYSAWLAQHDDWARRPLAERFASMLDGPVGALAQLEAAVGAPVTRDPHAVSLGTQGERFRLARGCRILDLELDAVELAEGVELGTLLFDEALQPLHTDGALLELRPTTLLVGADLVGDRLVLDLSDDTAQRLRNIPEDGIDLHTDELRAIHQLGVLVPVRWAV